MKKHEGVIALTSLFAILGLVLSFIGIFSGASYSSQGFRFMLGMVALVAAGGFTLQAI